MSTLAEIEAAAARLNAAELEQLERRVHELALARRGSSSKVFTGADAARWWREREPMQAKESAAFADDIEAARNEINRPPRETPWA